MRRTATVAACPPSGKGPAVTLGYAAFTRAENDTTIALNILSNGSTVCKCSNEPFLLSLPD